MPVDQGQVSSPDKERHDRTITNVVNGYFCISTVCHSFTLSFNLHAQETYNQPVRFEDAEGDGICHTCDTLYTIVSCYSCHQHDLYLTFLPVQECPPIVAAFDCHSFLNPWCSLPSADQILSCEASVQQTPKHCERVSLVVSREGRQEDIHVRARVHA